MRTVKLDSSFILLSAIFLLAAAGGLTVIFAVRADPLKEALSGDRVVSTLFVIEDGGKPLSSFVLMYYPETARGAVFDVPGSVGLIIQSLNRVDSIDALYAPRRYGDFQREVGSLLGLDIAFRVILSVENLAGLVDLLEGVELFVPDPMAVYGAGDPILLPSGLVRLDGGKARLYATYELAEDDREDGVTRRQRLFLALLKRLGERNEYLKGSEVFPFFDSLIETSVDGRTAMRLFDAFAALDSDRIAMQRVGGNLREVSGKTLLFPFYDGNLIKEIVKQTLSSLVRKSEGTITERVFTVEVLNGTPSSGLARRTAELLRGFGYDIIAVSNADRNDHEKTTVVDRSGYEDMARIFADVIRCSNIRSESRYQDSMDLQNLEIRADFTIIIGKDFNGRYVVE